jgi:excisionase family DNA binding protein
VNGDPPLPASPEQLLTPARAAAIAERSVKTIRRAYSSGRLPAYRDGGGRCVRIAYRDLRAWLTAEEIGSSGRSAAERPVLLALARERRSRRP